MNKTAELRTIPISELRPAEYNPRVELQPGDKDYEDIKRSIQRFGFADPLVVNADMTIIGGHQRLNVAKDLGYTEVPCAVVDLSKAEERALNVALNKMGGRFDNTKLAHLLKDLSLGGFDTTLTGYTIKEKDELINGLTLNVEAVEDDAEEVIDSVESITETYVRKGQVWQLGRHRLMCGDSTSLADMEKLMEGQQADLIITDPPYNVQYVGKTKDSLTIENDSMSDGAFFSFLLDTFGCMFSYAREGAAIYVFHADTEGLNFRRAFKEAGFKLSECLVWAKDVFVLGRQDYHWRHEPILYGWKEGAGHYFVNDRTQDTVLNYERPKRSEEHPTMKPVPLVGKLMQNSSMLDWKVLDPFGGSGSTLIAAQQLDRQCFTMELDPRYAQVIIERWQNLTGDKAVLLDE